MRSMISYTQAAMERAMKVQEVILRALAKKISWWQAAEIIGITTRSLGFAGCLTGDEGNRRPSEWRWPPWSGCWNCIVSAIST